jgi:hypothetical protein
LDKERSINNLQLCLNDFRATHEKAPKAAKEKTEKKEEGRTVFDKNKKHINDLIKANDKGIPPDIKNQIGQQPEKQKEEKVDQTADQTSLEQKDPIWQRIFLNLRNLVGDAEMLHHTPESLFKVLNSSQLTIVADSSDLVLLCITQKNLEELSEPVRRRIEREIKEQLFVDYDRPFTAKEHKDNFLDQYRGWFRQRQEANDQVQVAKRNKSFQGIRLPVPTDMVEAVDQRYKQVGKRKKCMCEKCKVQRILKIKRVQKHDFIKQNEKDLKEI